MSDDPDLVCIVAIRYRRLLYKHELSFHICVISLKKKLRHFAIYVILTINFIFFFSIIRQRLNKIILMLVQAYILPTFLVKTRLFGSPMALQQQELSYLSFLF